MREPSKLLSTMDAKVWADEFMETKARLGEKECDHAMMLAWFANAIMAGFDEATRRQQAAIADLQGQRKALNSATDNAIASMRKTAQEAEFRAIQAEQRVAQLEGERDEVSKKYHEAMDIMSAWKNIDHAEAAARLRTLQADHATLLGLVQATTKLLTELTIIPIGCSREQELAWKKAVKDLRAASLPAQPAQGGEDERDLIADTYNEGDREFIALCYEAFAALTPQAGKGGGA